MNRHLTPPLSVADHILGQTVPPKQDQPAEPAWQAAAISGYEQRTVNGKVEMRPVPGSLPERPDPASSFKAEVQRHIDAAADGWLSGAPPERGWYVADTDKDSGWRMFWTGEMWGGPVLDGNDNHHKLKYATELVHERPPIFWRLPRLTGPDWPEPAHA